MSRRRKDSVLDNLLEMLIVLPWWMGPIVIFGVFSFFYGLVPWLFAMGPESDVSKISTPIFAEWSRNMAPYVAGLATLVWVVALVKKPRG